MFAFGFSAEGLLKLPFFLKNISKSFLKTLDISPECLEKRVSLSWRYHLRDTLFTCVLLLTVTVYFLFACFYHVIDHNVIGYRNFLLNHA